MDFRGIYYGQMVNKPEIIVKFFEVPFKIIFNSKAIDKMTTFFYAVGNA